LILFYARFIWVSTFLEYVNGTKSNNNDDDD